MRFLGAILLSLLSAETLSATDPRAELSRAARYFQDGRAHAAEFVQTFTPAGFTRPQRESGTVTIQAPENLRFDYLAPARKVFTYDGATARFYSAAESQMISRRISAEERATLPLVFLQSPEALGKAYDLTVETGGGDLTIRLSPRAAGSEIGWIRLAVASGGAPARLSFASLSGDRTEFRFENFRNQPPRPESDFRFSPPPGTRILDNDR